MAVVSKPAAKSRTSSLADAPRQPVSPTEALLEAATRGDVETVKLLLEAGVRADVRNANGLTALMLA
ncbi:MAG: hypothetical protein GTO41_00695, partial [Burkholderiales bacterium]|nr:hypothetical protein [Burkholderiales bacterium]